MRVLAFLLAFAPGLVFAKSMYYTFVESIYYINKGKYSKASRLLSEIIKNNPNVLAPRIELIKLYMSSGNWFMVYQEAKNTTKLFPESYEANMLLGKSALLLGRLKEARKSLEKAVSIKPEKEAYSLLVETLFRTGDLKGVKEYAKKMINLFPNSPMGFYYLGRYYVKVKDYKKAEENLKRAIKLSPYFLSPYKELGSLYLDIGKTKEAVSVYEKLLRIDPHNIEAMEKLLNIYLKTKDTKKAERILEKMNRVLGPHAGVNKKLALIYMENGEYEKAERILRKILKENPEDDEARYYLGAVLIEENRTDEAIDEFLKISPSSPTFDSSRATLISILYRLGKKDDAKKLLVLSLKRKPQSTTLLKLLVDMYMDEKDYKNALKTLDRILSIAGNDTDTLYKKGVVLEKMGRRKEAIEVMKRILEIEPDDPSALNFIGYCYAEEGKKLQEAKRMIEKALKKRPKDGYILDSMGWVYFQMGDYKEAYRWIKKALEARPNDPVINEHMGDVLIKLGNTTSALRFYRISLKIFLHSGEEKEAQRIKRKIKELSGEELENIY